MSFRNLARVVLLVLLPVLFAALGYLAAIGIHYRYQGGRLPWLPRGPVPWEVTWAVVGFVIAAAVNLASLARRHPLVALAFVAAVLGPTSGTGRRREQGTSE